jgi:Fungal trichothecene efflux pump (TRI12)
MGAGAALGMVIAGILFKPIGRAKYQLLVCCIGMSVFFAGLAAANQYHKSLAAAFTLLGGICVGFLMLITPIVAGLVCEPGDIDLASSFLASLQQIFGTIATTIYATILDNRLKFNLPADVTPAAIGAGLQKSSFPALLEAITIGTPAAFTRVPGITPNIMRAVSVAL